MASGLIGPDHSGPTGEPTSEQRGPEMDPAGAPPPVEVRDAGDARAGDTTGTSPPRTVREAWGWLVLAVVGFVVGQVFSAVLLVVGAAVDGPPP